MLRRSHVGGLTGYSSILAMQEGCAKVEIRGGVMLSVRRDARWRLGLFLSQRYTVHSDVHKKERRYVCEGCASIAKGPMTVWSGHANC